MSPIVQMLLVVLACTATVGLVVMALLIGNRVENDRCEMCGWRMKWKPGMYQCKRCLDLIANHKKSNAQAVRTGGNHND